MRSTWIVALLCLLASSAWAQPEVKSQFEKGMTNYEAGEYKLAIAEFNKVLKAQPEHAGALKGRADSRHKMGNFGVAIQDYEAAKKLDPSNAELFFNCGAAKISISDFKGAIKDLSKSIEIDPNNPKVYFFRGTAQINAKKLKGALNDFNKAIELDPNYSQAYYNRGTVLGQMGRYAECKNDFKKSVDLNPELTSGLFNIALSKLGEKDYEGAIKDFSEIIELKNDDEARAYFYRGEANYQLKKKDSACSDWEMASKAGHDEAAKSFTEYCKKNKKKTQDVEITF